MAGNRTYTAVLDACVLYPVSVADALMSMAQADFYAAKWTTAIEDEWIRNLQADRPELASKLNRRRDQMRIAVPDWEVSEDAYTPLIPGLSLPDPGDLHVLAAAIAGHADCIVTANTKHFPKESLAPFNVCAIHPDEFLSDQFDLKPIVAIEAYKAMRARWRNPVFSAEDFVQVFQRNGLVSVSDRLREAIGLI